uniref:CSON002456 protein n=1 Tax=Culicoides sonorensis TaxID=179676 RepID=A0A336LSF0_CULSO
MESPGPLPQMESFSNLIVEDENRKQKIDLQKLFTPSTDFEEIKPGKNRKLYASSAFWAPGVHPTVEDQVELARRISHSLSDISNQRSKGQSMYINRKKRSVKWVHEADGEDGNPEQTSYSYTDTSNRVNDHEERSEQTEITSNVPKKVPLKLVMNPQGHIQDFSSLQKSDTLPILSPEPIISALKVSKEKGAELFAKRRKKADKWIIDELNSEKSKPQFNNSSVSKSTTTTSSSSTTVQESYSSSTKKIDEAIETISQSFNDMTPISNTPVAEPERKQETPSTYIATSLVSQSPTIIPYPRYQGLAYRPSIAQGWNAPPIKLSIETPYENDEPIRLFKRKMSKDENKENEVPEIDASLKDELLKDEKEIMEIYEDLDRHLKLIEEDTTKKPEVTSTSIETDGNRNETESVAVSETLNDTPKPPEIPVFKPVNVIKILNEPPPPLPELQFTMDEDDDFKGGSGESKEGTAEGDEEYAKISVKDLINTFENVQSTQKVHVREIDKVLIREPSIPKYLQLFTGQQPKQEVETSKVLPEQPKSVEEEKVEAPKPVPQPQFEPVKPVTQQKPEQIQAPLPQNSNQSPYEELNIVNKLIEKHESRIKENQCDVINVPSNGYLEPVPEPTPAPEPPKPYELTIPVKRDALSNISPLPFIQNPEPLPTGISVKMPEPEPPKKPDYSYEAFLHNSPPEQYNIPPPPKALELSNLMSYNTAPRGWGAAKDYYRPVHVGQKYDNMIYSDF